ncbi:hypothetical protein HOY80DRAFT_1036924 [Tuber brumale]|nr:hypothetical protein HOY80DRAFT_1036924 [Tuber brumale]
MSVTPPKGISEHSIPTGSSLCSKNAKTVPQIPVSLPNPPKAQPAPDTAGAGPSRLACPADPVSGADVIRLAEDNEVEEERKSRTTGFELRAKNMGIIGAKSVAEKVLIWEGIWAAEQTGNDISVGILLDVATNINE